jgi:hypothetical protein
MPLLLVLEDALADLRIVMPLARRAGFDEFEISERVIEARMYLEQAIAKKGPLPEALFIDLDRGLDAGCELLRFRNAHASLKDIPAIIWTVLGNHEREKCRKFGALSFVSKTDDQNVLIAEFSNILACSRQVRAD